MNCSIQGSNHDQTRIEYPNTHQSDTIILHLTF